MEEAEAAEVRMMAPVELWTPVGEKPWAPVGEEPWAPVGRSRPAALLEVDRGTKGRCLDRNEGRFMVVHRFRCARGVRFE
jgi:hypothetical protein